MIHKGGSKILTLGMNDEMAVILFVNKNRHDHDTELMFP